MNNEHRPFDPRYEEQRRPYPNYDDRRPPAYPPPPPPRAPTLDAQLFLRVIVAAVVATVTAHCLQYLR